MRSQAHLGSKDVFPERRARCKLVAVAEELSDDQTLIMEVLFDIRRNTSYIIELLREEEEDGQEEADDS